MNKLYVSLPITGRDYDDVCRRCEAAERMYGGEWTVITPVNVCRGLSGPYGLFLGRCVEALLECDAAVFLDGWTDSRGCRTENFICETYGIPTFTDYAL